MSEVRPIKQKKILIKLQEEDALIDANFKQRLIFTLIKHQRYSTAKIIQTSEIANKRILTAFRRTLKMTAMKMITALLLTFLQSEDRAMGIHTQLSLSPQHMCRFHHLHINWPNSIKEGRHRHQLKMVKTVWYIIKGFRMIKLIRST